MAETTKTAPGVPTLGASGAPDPSYVATDRLLAKHGSDKHEFAKFGSLPPKPGSAPRGRPRSDGLPAGSSLPPPSARVTTLAPAVATPAMVDGLARPPIDPILLRKSVEACIAGIDVCAVSYITGKASKVFTPGEARQIGESVRCPLASREIIAQALPPVMDKYGIGSEFLPEIALLSGIGGWLGGIGAAVNRIDELVAEKAAKEAPKLPAAAAVPALAQANAPT